MCPEASDKRLSWRREGEYSVRNSTQFARESGELERYVIVQCSDRTCCSNSVFAGEIIVCQDLSA